MTVKLYSNSLPFPSIIQVQAFIFMLNIIYMIIMAANMAIYEGDRPCLLYARNRGKRKQSQAQLIHPYAFYTYNFIQLCILLRWYEAKEEEEDLAQQHVRSFICCMGKCLNISNITYVHDNTRITWYGYEKLFLHMVISVCCIVYKLKSHKQTL